MKRQDLLYERQKEAEARNGAWALLSPEKKLEQLDARLGAGVGAVKQRARIARKIVEVAE